MNLHPEPFNLIKNREKTIEMRLFDERRKDIRVGDLISFTNNETKEELLVKVIELKTYKTFYELYKHYEKSLLGYKKDEDANPDDMYKYYSEELIDKYGVLAIRIELL